MGKILRSILTIFVLVVACLASHTEYLYQKEILGDFAMISGGCYFMARIGVMGAGFKMASINKWIPWIVFISISLTFTIWSTGHIAGNRISLFVLWIALAGELAVGISHLREDNANWRDLAN